MSEGAEVSIRSKAEVRRVMRERWPHVKRDIRPRHSNRIIQLDGLVLWRAGHQLDTGLDGIRLVAEIDQYGLSACLDRQIERKKGRILLGLRHLEREAPVVRSLRRACG